MLANLRRNSRNAIIYVLFGILIAVFVSNFGPQSGGCGTSSGKSYAAKVGSSTLTERDFRMAYIALGGPQMGAQARERRLKEFVMDKLIERELLAQEGERLGFAVGDEEILDMILDGRMIILGMPRRVDSYVFKDGKFDHERFKSVSQNQLGVSVKRFIEIQRREVLAERVRDVFKVGSKVGPDEVKTDFETKGLQINLEYVRFSPRRFDDDTEATPAEIDAWIKDHGADLKKQYDDRAFLYKKLDKEARLRQIVIDVPKDATKEKLAEAEKQINDAVAKLKAGTSFAELAKTISTDERGKKRGGLIGWRKKQFTGIGPALDVKVFAEGTKKGDLLGPEKTERGWHLVLVEDYREGDIPLEVAQRELAEDAMRTDRAKAKAKKEAEAVLVRIKAGEKLEVIVPKETPEDSEDKKNMNLAQKLIDKPKLLETGMFSRRGELVQDIGTSRELAKKAFALKVGEIAGPFEASGSWVIVRAKERKEPDLTDFDKRKDELIQQFASSKWAEMLDGWSKQRCLDVKTQGRISINDEVLQYESATGRPMMKYEPCVGTRLF